MRGDEVPGTDHVVVLGDGLWRRRFAADPGVVGRSHPPQWRPVRRDRGGAAGFGFPRGAELPAGFQFPAETELWVPAEPPQRGPSELAAVARLKPGISVAAATEDLTRITRIVETLIPAGKGWFGARMVPLRQQLTGGVAPLLVMLLAAVGLVLGVACVNTAQLFLARLQARRRELAVRAALGASGRRLATELVVEAVLLAGSRGCGGRRARSGGRGVDPHLRLEPRSPGWRSCVRRPERGRRRGGDAPRRAARESAARHSPVVGWQWPRYCARVGAAAPAGGCRAAPGTRSSSRSSRSPWCWWREPGS